ncbi:MAG: insulinase family protein [Acidobacteriia bacterium]|nr:insulinase family protein [Terriglobia bacterium]
MIRRRIVWVLFCSAIAWTVFAGSPSVGAAQAKPAMKPASAAAPSKAEATVRPLHLNIQPHQLANGLHVLMVEDRSAPVINLQVWYHVGSKDEKPGRTGFAHIFEHMMFKGSAHVGPDEHSRIIEAAGGFDNAYTNDDVTVYWQTFPSNCLERVIWLEADRLGSLNVDEANFKSEREVVKEERRVGVENRPYGRVFEDLADAAFTVHPYKHTTIGSMDDLNKATLEDVRSFHRTFYRPDNATMVIVGDFVASQAVAWVEKYFSGIPKPAAPIPRVTVQEPPQTTERRFSKWYGSESPLPAIIEAYHMSAEFTLDSYPLILASNILSGGESSRLYRQLVYKDQVALQTAGIGNFTEHPNLFLAFAVLNPGKSVPDGEKALQGVLDDMRTAPVSAEELQKAKNQQISSDILGRVTDQEKADAIGRAAVIGRDPNLVNTSLEQFLRVTPADIQRVAKEYLDPSHRTIMLIEPPKAEAKQGGNNQ